jgi:hypothetical protein
MFTVIGAMAESSEVKNTDLFARKRSKKRTHPQPSLIIVINRKKEENESR